MRTYLKELRENLNLTQLGVAQKLNISEGSYSLIENGKRQSDMTISMAQKLASIFDVSIDVILENESK